MPFPFAFPCLNAIQAVKHSHMTHLLNLASRVTFPFSWNGLKWVMFCISQNYGSQCALMDSVNFKIMNSFNAWDDSNIGKPLIGANWALSIFATINTPPNKVFVMRVLCRMMFKILKNSADSLPNLSNNSMSMVRIAWRLNRFLFWCNFSIASSTKQNMLKTYMSQRLVLS